MPFASLAIALSGLIAVLGISRLTREYRA
jgi:hypothetical protein